MTQREKAAFFLGALHSLKGCAPVNIDELAALVLHLADLAGVAKELEAMEPECSLWRIGMRRFEAQ